MDAAQDVLAMLHLIKMMMLQEPLCKIFVVNIKI